MALYKITAKLTGTWNSVRMEKGMTVEVVSGTDPISLTKGKEEIRAAFKRKYNVDFKGLISRAYLTAEKIS